MDLKRHLEAPEVSVADYLGTLLSQVATQVRGRHKVYLDTRYWVFIRDAALGRAKRPEHEAILRALRDKVASGVAMCPVSDIAVLEMTAQTDDETRAATAILWDELSLGVALRTEPERILVEVEQFFASSRPDEVPRPLQDLAWTRPCFVLGTIVPGLKQFPRSFSQAVQKAALDALWTATFTEIAKDSSASLALSEKSQRTAENINLEMRKFQHEVPSFEKALLAEISGALDASEGLLTGFLMKQFLEQGHSLHALTEKRLLGAHKTLRTGLVNAFRLRRDVMARRLPSLYLQAACHAAIRTDVKRKVNGNLLRDIHHGSAGVAYHDAVLTENPLKVLLTAGNVAADKTFSCRVMSHEHEVLDYLERL